MKVITMNNLPPRWRLWVIFSVLVTVSVSLSSAVGFGSLVEVNGSVNVFRGGQVDLTHVISIHDPPTECNVRFISSSIGHSCGVVSPNQFDCGNYRGPILYQHYGCFSDRELLTFQITVFKKNYSTVDYSNEHSKIHIFSIEILVENSYPTINLTKNEPRNATHNVSTHSFRVMFPQSLIQKCYYEIVDGWPSLDLPSFGSIDSRNNQVLPCGYVHTNAITYTPNINNISTDYILVKMYYYEDGSRNQSRTQYVILPFQLEPNSSERTFKILPSNQLVVRQVSNAPVLPSLLMLDGDYSQQYPVLRYVFPILPAGSFQSVQSTSVNMTHTSFTNLDLLQGAISFHPSDLLYEKSVTTVYTYNVTDVAGTLVAVGNISVVAQYNQTQPAQRTNKPLVVIEGKRTLIDFLIIDFYLLGRCVMYGVMQVKEPPRHGQLLFLNGDHVNDSVMMIDAVRNGTVLMYEHSGDESTADFLVWKVGCLSDPVLYVYMSILVAPINDIPPQIQGRPTVTVYRNWAIPLTPSLLRISDFDSSNIEISVKVLNQKIKSKGLVVKLTRDSLDDFSLGMPFLERDIVLRSGFNESSELSFMLPDVENYSIWYIPPTSGSNDTIDLILSDLSNEIYVNNALTIIINNRNLRHDLLSTNTSYPTLLLNKPLPIHSHLGVYLTSSNLYSHELEHSSDQVIYIIEIPPTKGLLCRISQEPCNSSVLYFTQQDVIMNTIVYLPESEKLADDAFKFEVTLDEVKHYDACSYWFNMSAVEKEGEFSMDKVYWVKNGGKRRIPAKIFRQFRSILSKRIEIIITSQPHYGSLVFRHLNKTIISYHPQRFEFSDLIESRLWYEHHGLSLHACSDRFNFTVTNGTHTLPNKIFTILLKQDSPQKLDVSLSPRTLQGQAQFVFSSTEFNVTSPFCPEFVEFTLTAHPIRGALSLVSVQYGTILLLQTNSTFTAKDVQSGYLRYSLIDPSSAVDSYDEFDLIASDPADTWPPGSLDSRLHPGSYNTSVETVNTLRLYVPPSLYNVTRIDILITSPRPLTWLPQYEGYGHIMTEREIYINSTIRPEQLMFQLIDAPLFGNVMKNNTLASYFSMEDVLNGIVWYHSIIRPVGIFKVTLRLGVVADSHGRSNFGPKEDFVIEWAAIQVDRTSITVAEEAGVVNIILRYVHNYGGVFISSVQIIVCIHIYILC